MTQIKTPNAVTESIWKASINTGLNSTLKALYNEVNDIDETVKMVKIILKESKKYNLI